MKLTYEKPPSLLLIILFPFVWLFLVVILLLIFPITWIQIIYDWFKLKHSKKEMVQNE